MAKRSKTGAALAMAVSLALSGGVVAAEKGTVTGLSDRSSPAPAAAPATAAEAGSGGLGDAEMAGIGCAISAGTVTTATYIAGPSEAILLLGGGLLVPSGSAILGLSLMAAIGASTCSIGAIVTPTALWFYDQSGNLASAAGKVGSDAVRGVASLFGFSQQAALQPVAPRQAAAQVSGVIQP